jgi:menaquinone-dependent protoporphyrinogen IX oxidase
MKVCIVHDSEKGNGRQMAEKLASELTARGAEVRVGHRLELTPEQVAADPPDLLLLGAAVRKFVTSPPVKKWVSRLGAELKRRKARIPHAAVFLTHLMPDSMVRNRVARLQRSLSAADGIGEVHPQWLSGRVENMAGPFVAGALEAAGAFAAGLHERVLPKS